ncbi:glycine betaine ABC transporter substrate-binding protein [Salirhabdus salicampi]|uniref:glycine betaine ABC transporter substrate-binding protein n=1 Tax=Salirhabdus salicampi TaxID=476102 RepID=UPI0020C41B69|nr:glycine betaine ABC transporter substrate-binding protein [Salirhabdus salicampi]MCP8618140.1 glycine/betaine ABC transporter substrate-binding protein [Salirhabdus salicampi]
MKKLLLAVMATTTLLFAAACGSNGDGEITELEIGTQTYTDPKIMAHMVEALVEDRTDIEVSIKKDISASPQIISAMDQGELHIATLYSGEVYNNHFDDDELEFTTDPEVTLDQAQRLFAEHFDFTWHDSLGFQNKYTVTIDGEFAAANNIEKISDLVPHADQLRFGTDGSWLERPNDGYRAFKEHYGFEFKDARGLQIELMYEGVENNELDVITAYSVDPQILELGLKVLEDDKNFFPPYTASLVARNDVLEEVPEVAEAIDSLTGQIDEQTMTQLIYEVDINKRDEQEVAVEFLKEIGLLQ